MRALDRLCRAILALLVIIALSASGCATTATYNAAYVSTPAMPQGDKLAGKVLIFTERIDDETLFVGAPTSFSGGGTKLTIPLGVIAREIAATVFGDLFVNGAVKANALQGATGYRAVVKPKVSSFSYAYNQLKNRRRDRQGTAHKAVYDLMRKAASDVGEDLLKGGSPVLSL